MKWLFHLDLATRNVLLKGDIASISDFGKLILILEIILNISGMARIKESTEDTKKTTQEVGPLKW